MPPCAHATPPHPTSHPNAPPLHTHAASTSVLAVLAGQLPGDWGHFSALFSFLNHTLAHQLLCSFVPPGAHATPPRHPRLTISAPPPPRSHTPSHSVHLGPGSPGRPAARRLGLLLLLPHRGHHAGGAGRGLHRPGAAGGGHRQVLAGVPRLQGEDSTTSTTTSTSTSSRGIVPEHVRVIVSEVASGQSTGTHEGVRAEA